MTNVITIQGVRGYCDMDGTAWLNAEDVARGLGFVEVKKDRVATNGDNYEAVRWNRVNGYLQEFGFSTQVSKDDFIPENMFYRLAMKANNEAAQAFQAKIADEIMPTLRKTGSYSIVQYSRPVLRGDEVQIISMYAKDIESLFAVKRGIAIAQAIDVVGTNLNLQLDNLKQLLPPAEHETGYLNATQLGEKLGLKSQATNKFLAQIGWQYRDSNKNWRLTELGKQYGEEMPYTRNGHSGYQIRWSESTVEILKKGLSL